MLPSAVVHRRALHQIPELSDQLPETVAYVLSVLSPLSCTLSQPIPGAVCAFFDAGKPETVAFRADMDALPVEEATGLKPVLWDERRTTVDAHRILFDAGKNGKKRKKTVDAVAASLILEGYLAFRRMRG